MTAKDLAKLAIEVLDAQKRYFRDRNRENLIKSKALEAELRRRANEILEAPDDSGTDQSRP